MKTAESLLLAVRADEGVDGNNIDIVDSLDSVLDLVLVSTGVNKEGKGVAGLDSLHGRVGEEGRLDNRVLAEDLLVADRVADVLRGTSKTKGVGADEARRSADLLGLNNGTDLVGLSSLSSLLNGGVLLVNCDKNMR